MWKQEAFFQLEELQQELELQTELANNRLTELQEVTERNKSLSAELENCKMKVSTMKIFHSHYKIISVKIYSIR
jgi:hypothetical protein